MTSTDITLAELSTALSGQRVDLHTAAALTGRTEATIKRWERAGELHPTPTGRTQGPGKVRLFDPDELRAVNAQHGGRWHGERMPPPASNVAALAAEVQRLRLEVHTLRSQVEALRDEVASARRSGTLTRTLPDPPADPPLPRVAWHPAPAAAHRESAGSRPGSLPDGLVSLIGFAELHGARETQRSTFKKAVTSGRLPVIEGRWKQGRAYVNLALDAAGRHRFYELWHETDWWQDCDDCPHDLDAQRRLDDE